MTGHDWLMLYCWVTVFYLLVGWVLAAIAIFAEKYNPEYKDEPLDISGLLLLIFFWFPLAWYMWYRKRGT